ncbi:MAG: ATP-binding cassette domain-containing protein, partial [Actinomyces sp.]
MARVINVQDLTMRIGARQLVAHAGFRVDKGMRIGLVGRNGAGKTTMTKLLAAASVAQGAGRAVNDADERHGLEAVEHEGTITCTSSVGYLPQDTKVGDLSEIARDRILSARGYEDLGLLTCDRDVAQDLTTLFNQLSGYAPRARFRRLLVAPRGLRDGLVERIE